jgi:hypothetical protein
MPQIASELAFIFWILLTLTFLIFFNLSAGYLAIINIIFIFAAVLSSPE